MRKNYFCYFGKLGQSLEVSKDNHQTIKTQQNP